MPLFDTMPVKRKIRGRSHLARAAHFRTGAGAQGGTRRQQARRRRARARQDERAAEQGAVEAGGEGG